MIVGTSQCRARNGNIVHDASMICAGGRGQIGCHGDSGGPLACYEHGRWILRGVVSWGNQSCVSYYYTVFTRVSSLVDWIYRTQNTGRNTKILIVVYMEKAGKPFEMRFFSVD